MSYAGYCILDMVDYAVGIIGGTALLFVGEKRRQGKWVLLADGILILLLGILLYGSGMYAVTDKDAAYMFGWLMPMGWSLVFFGINYPVTPQTLISRFFAGWSCFYIKCMLIGIAHLLIVKNRFMALLFTYYTPMFYVMSLLFYVLLYGVFYLTVLRSMSPERRQTGGTGFLIVWGMLVFLLTSQMNLASYVPEDHLEGQIIQRMLQLVYCLLFLAVYISYCRQLEEHAKRLEAEAELVTVQQLLEADKRSYERQAETIDIINRKCHDMRHQLRAIEQGGRLSPGECREMEDAIRIYDSHIETGNRALDIVLSDYNMRCSEYGIVLSVICDGSELAFLADSEIYSFFGNALENALEYLLTIEDVTKRYMMLRVVKKHGLLMIAVENYYEGADLAPNELPITKKDTVYHGYGIRSMESIAQKYGGALQIRTGNHLFSVQVCFAK